MRFPAVGKKSPQAQGCRPRRLGLSWSTGLGARARHGQHMLPMVGPEIGLWRAALSTGISASLCIRLANSILGGLMQTALLVKQQSREIVPLFSWVTGWWVHSQTGQDSQGESWHSRENKTPHQETRGEEESGSRHQKQEACVSPTASLMAPGRCQGTVGRGGPRRVATTLRMGTTQVSGSRRTMSDVIQATSSWTGIWKKQQNPVTHSIPPYLYLLISFS